MSPLPKIYHSPMTEGCRKPDSLQGFVDVEHLKRIAATLDDDKDKKVLCKLLPDFQPDTIRTYDAAPVGAVETLNNRVSDSNQGEQQNSAAHVQCCRLRDYSHFYCCLTSFASQTSS